MVPMECLDVSRVTDHACISRETGHSFSMVRERRVVPGANRDFWCAAGTRGPRGPTGREGMMIPASFPADTRTAPTGGAGQGVA